MKQISETFQITKKDNLRYNFFLMQKKLVATSVLVFVIILGMIGVTRYMQGANLTSAIFSGLLMGLAGTALLIAINIGTAVLRINNYYKQNKLSNFGVTFTTDAEGMHGTSERGNFDLPWSRIVAVRETHHAFYIFITDSHANVMPKDQFSSADAIAAFRALLEKNVVKSRLRIKQAKQS